MRPAWIDDLHPIFRYSFLAMEVWQWIGLGVLVVLALIGNLTGRLAASWILKFHASFAGRECSDDTHKGFRVALGLIAAAYFPYLLVPILDLPVFLQSAIEKGLETVLLLGMVLVAFALWDAASDTIATRTADHDQTSRILVPVARKFVRALILLAGVLVGLAFIFSINVTAVVASLGIGGLVVALAAKDSVENVFGSITILFDMPFGIGDWVRVGEVDGTVEEINLRSTRIRTFEDSVITLPNSNLIKAAVENYGRRRFRRLRTTLGLEYATPPEKVDEFCAAVRDLLESHPHTRKDALRAEFYDYGESSLNVLLYCYIEAPDYNEELKIRHGIMLEIMRIAQRVGVGFAFPTRTVHLAPARTDEPLTQSDNP